MSEAENSTGNSNLSRRGGARPGAGRRPLAITTAAAEIVDKFRLLEVAKDIAIGDIWEEWTNREGEVVSSPTKNSDRLAAIKLLIEYGHGKPTQTIQGPDGGPVQVQVVNSPGFKP